MASASINRTSAYRRMTSFGSSAPTAGIRMSRYFRGNGTCDPYVALLVWVQVLTVAPWFHASSQVPVRRVSFAAYELKKLSSAATLPFVLAPRYGNVAFGAIWDDIRPPRPCARVFWM